MILGVHHFAVIVSSEESTAFYKKLGFREILRKERRNDTVVLLSGYGIQLELFIDPRHPKREAFGPLGLRHLALRVDKIEDTAEDLGLTIETIMTDWVGVRFVFITDPDGNEVELHE